MMQVLQRQIPMVNTALPISRENCVVLMRSCIFCITFTFVVNHLICNTVACLSQFTFVLLILQDLFNLILLLQYKGSYRLRLYERNNFGGKMLEATDDCPSVSDRFNHHDIQSCHVFDGYWIFYELPHYIGRQYCLRPGEYRRFTDWGALNARVGSFKQIAEFSQINLIKKFTNKYISFFYFVTDLICNFTKISL